jgi:IclR family acetate operon transcriptional repressor
MGEERGASSTQLIRKVRQILDCFVPANSTLSLTDIRQQTGIPTTTALRLLRSLVDEGFVSRDTAGSYQLGMGIIRYAAAVDRGASVVQAAAPVMQELLERTGETVSLIVRSGLTRVTVAVAPSRKAIVQQTFVGDTSPLQAGSSSKVLLAFDPAGADEVIAAGLQSFTSSSVVEEAAFREELERTRGQRYAESDSEFSDMVASVSCPVVDGAGTIVAALCVGGPSNRLTPAVRQELVGDVMACADTVSRALGWAGDTRQLA